MEHLKWLVNEVIAEYQGTIRLYKPILRKNLITEFSLQVQTDAGTLDGFPSLIIDESDYLRDPDPTRWKNTVRQHIEKSLAERDLASTHY